MLTFQSSQSNVDDDFFINHFTSLLGHFILFEVCASGSVFPVSSVNTTSKHDSKLFGKKCRCAQEERNPSRSSLCKMRSCCKMSLLNEFIRIQTDVRVSVFEFFFI